MLTAAGLHVGLHTSPYLQVATEKLQIGGELIDASSLRAIASEVHAASVSAGVSPVTYGEFWFALVALAFANAKVDIAVVEVGAGGRFDLTNVVEPAVSVITSVGLDHTETLGSTIPEIAWHKAGIIKPGAPVVSAVTDPDAMAVIEQEAETTGSRLIRAIAGDSFALEPAGNGLFSWRLTDQPDETYRTGMPGRFQAINAATALLAIKSLPPELVRISSQDVRMGLSRARLQGRYEAMQESPTVVLDGAHNPEKMRALAREVRTWRDAHPGARVVVVFGVLEAKEHLAMAAEIVKIADELVTTSPQVLAKPGTRAEELAREAAALGFAGPVLSVDDPGEALNVAIGRAGDTDLVLVTGSLYLVGNVRGRWYPDDEIVIQQTPWPVATKVTS
jgi:dihydrofolate synthase/folylpolyglutamate synthase